MHKLLKIIMVIIITNIASFAATAQDVVVENKPQMADALRANGKIYVVVVVVVTILAGVFFYLVRIDRKIAKLEKQG
jgi:CcmD family protein